MQISEYPQSILRSLLSLGVAILVGCSTTPKEPIQISESDMRAEYDRLFAAAEKMEQYRVRHILTSTREGAQTAIERLKRGEPFAKVALELSIDTRSNREGGELGWSWPDYYVDEFSKVMVSLAPRGISDAPVKTRSGWHVIEVTEVRYVTPFPAFEEVRDKIVERLRQKARVQ